MSHHIGPRCRRPGSWSPGVGGRWLDRAKDGTEFVWGSVLAWEPPRRMVMSWADERGRRARPRPRARLRGRGHLHPGRRRHPGRAGAPAPGPARRTLGRRWPARSPRTAAGRRSSGNTARPWTCLPVRASITVAAPVEKAWRVYTEQYGSWYPRTTSSATARRDVGDRAARGRPLVREASRRLGAGVGPGAGVAAATPARAVLDVRGGLEAGPGPGALVRGRGAVLRGAGGTG